MDLELLEKPVIQRAVIFELQRTKRVSHSLDRVRLAMRKIVSRINAPSSGGPMMRRAQDTIHHWVAYVDVRRSHVDLGAQRSASIRELTRPHAPKQIEILVR